MVVTHFMPFIAIATRNTKFISIYPIKVSHVRIRAKPCNCVENEGMIDICVSQDIFGVTRHNIFNGRGEGEM